MTMPQQGRRIERLTDKGQLVNNLLICAAQLAKYRAGTNVCCGSYLGAKHSAGADHERSEAWKSGAAARRERLTRLVRDWLHCVCIVACDLVTVAGCRSLKESYAAAIASISRFVGDNFIVWAMACASSARLRQKFASY